MRRETIRCLKETAAKCRLNVVRMLRASGHGHIGGTYSSIDMVTALYFYKMNVNPEKPDWEDRDRFLLSAGHKSMVQYAALAEKGYNPVNQIVGYILSGDPTYITSHNNARNKIRTIERDELLEKMVRNFIDLDK